MKRSRKNCFLALPALVLLLAAGCANPFEKQETADLPGMDIIKDSMKKYNGQNSGGIEVYDLTKDELSERFIYWYDEVGILTYYYEKTTEDGGVYKEYSSGYAYFVEEDGIGKQLTKADERYKFYDKDYSRHRYTTDSVFYLSDKGIKDSDVTENEDGSGKITYSYDAEKAKMAIDGGKVESFTVEYYYDENKEVTHFIQTTKGKYDNGEDINLIFKITVIPSESVGPIDNPITVTPVEDSSEEN